MYEDYAAQQKSIHLLSTPPAGPQPIASTPAVTEISYAANSLDEAISRLESKSHDLIVRLSMVIMKMPQVDGTAKPNQAGRQMFSPIGQGLADAAMRLNTAEARLDTILATLAI